MKLNNNLLGLIHTALILLVLYLILSRANRDSDMNRVSDSNCGSNLSGQVNSKIIEDNFIFSSAKNLNAFEYLPVAWHPDYDFPHYDRAYKYPYYFDRPLN